MLDTSTEKFEQVNGLGKEAFVSSNKKSPSKDIALAESRRLCCEFLLAGGKWLLEARYVVGVGEAIEAMLPLFATAARATEIPKPRNLSEETPSLASLDATWEV